MSVIKLPKSATKLLASERKVVFELYIVAKYVCTHGKRSVYVRMGTKQQQVNAHNMYYMQVTLVLYIENQNKR